jgi:predicted nucleic acid-binding protein
VVVPVYVLDASVGVKWYRPESGSREARDLLARHVAGEIILAVDSLFLYEVLNASTRGERAEEVSLIWEDLQGIGLAVVPLSDTFVDAAARQRDALGCSLYDAFACGLADLLHAPLYSADARAHGAFPAVRLLG